MPDYEVKIESLPRIRFAAIALPAPGFGADMMTEAVLSALLSLEGLLHAAGIEAQSPVFQVHDGDPDAGTLMTYVGIAVDDDVSEVPEPAQLYELPRVEHAAVVTRVVPYLTNYNDIYGELATWFEPRGYSHAGAGRDHYVDLSDLANAVMRTEWPLQQTGEVPPDTTPTRWTA